ncbi:hypothetical protein [Microcoleus sp. CAWBG58]|uniref:hypothetical protein n=1 Tax=Microcoleus sp. CAWBG58 TaxID=2841651 RepID=UPI0025E271F9|nr:hypothetical protein [Microcoleus sp. CAWBG58]
MTGSHPSLEKYEQEENRYWQQLRQEFNRYKSELDVTNVELAEGLGISRQPLVSFMNNSSHKLPIRRSHLMRLWDFLTAPEQIEHKNISDEAKSNREQLRETGANSLLKAAGFLPSSTNMILEVEPSRHQQLQRIASRLSNLPFTEFTDFIKITEAIEDEIVARYDRVSIADEQPVIDGYGSLKNIDTIVKQWWNDRIHHKKPSKKMLQALQEAITKLIALGKSEFNKLELFELFLCILENEQTADKMNKFLRKIRVTECQFKTLTFSLEEDTDDPGIKQLLKNAGIQAERCLRDDLYPEISDTAIEVSVTCNFGKTNQNVCWQYSSSGTYYDNMLAAVARGMGYRSSLKLVDLASRSLGRREVTTRLVKASATLKDEGTNDRGEKCYQGVWIDLDTITSILQSLVLAVRSWLSENLVDDELCKSYYEVCEAIANIENNLTYCQKLTSGYVFQIDRRLNDQSVRSYLKAASDQIQEIQKKSLKAYPIFKDFYESDLDRQWCMANLILARSAHIQINMTEAAEFLSEVRYSLNGNRQISEYKPVVIMYRLEEMLHRFLSGDSHFIHGKQWQFPPSSYNINDCLDELKNHIKEGNLKYGSYPGRFDFDVYLCASEIFTLSARLDFCSELESVEKLGRAAENFLMAAYCSSKIGLRLKAAHLLANASRVYCRLGDGDRSQNLADLTENIIKAEIKPTDVFSYQEAILAEVNIARGEKLLLIDGLFKKALTMFLMSLKGSIYLGFTRLIAQNFYNIGRACKQLETSDLKFAMLLKKSFDKQDLELFDEKKGWQKTEVATAAIHFLSNLEASADWETIAKLFKEEAKSIWHQWFAEANPGQEGNHPIEDAIDNYKFLCRLK